jgi:hypothetical protein
MTVRNEQGLHFCTTGCPPDCGQDWSVDVRLSALGMETPCQGCGNQWWRGEVMYAVVRVDGEPLGWHCAECVKVPKLSARRE